MEKSPAGWQPHSPCVTSIIVIIITHIKMHAHAQTQKTTDTCANLPPHKHTKICVSHIHLHIRVCSSTITRGLCIISTHTHTLCPYKAVLIIQEKMSLHFWRMPSFHLLLLFLSCFTSLSLPLSAFSRSFQPFGPALLSLGLAPGQRARGTYEPYRNRG